jgi:predicted metal-dependent hydrolase
MNGSVGSNTNKGGEIVLCLDGKTNEIFHVLIHELAHSTVDEYSHSPEFWKKYVELRNICVHLDIYQQIPQRTEFCGQHIQDK